MVYNAISYLLPSCMHITDICDMHCDMSRVIAYCITFAVDALSITQLKALSHNLRHNYDTTKHNTHALYIA